MKRRGRVICWDMDETLGEFRNPDRMRLVPGIIPLLEDLRNKGIASVITTAGNIDHLAMVLSKTGIGRHFERFFTRETICDGEMNKHYLPVACAFGITERNAPHRMLIVGNSPKDASADLEVPFLFHPYGDLYSAEVLSAVLSRLLESSDSWSGSHNVLRRSARGEFVGELFYGGIIDIDGITLGVGSCPVDRGMNPKIKRLMEVWCAPPSMLPEGRKEKTEELILPALSL